MYAIRSYYARRADHDVGAGRARIKVLHPTEKINLGLGLSIENYKTSVADSVGATPYSFEVGNTSLIQLNPNLNFELDNLKLKVGVLMAAVGTNNENTFFLAPDILADLTVVEGIVSLYSYNFV